MDQYLGRRSSGERHLLLGLTRHTRGHALLLLGVHPGLVVTSGRRTPLGNRRVGGVPTSWHLQGRAVDFDGPLPLLQAASLTAWAQRLGHGCTGPEEVLIHDPEHLHVAW